MTWDKFIENCKGIKKQCIVDIEEETKDIFYRPLGILFTPEFIYVNNKTYYDVKIHKMWQIIKTTNSALDIQ